MSLPRSSVYLIEAPPGVGGLTPGPPPSRAGSEHRAPAGAHYCGQAEVLADGRLALWLNRTTQAGHTARALLDDGILEPVLLMGPEPTIRLQVS